MSEMNKNEELRLIKSLERLSLTYSEAVVYLCLLKRPFSSASEVAKLTKIPRPRVYKILEKLEMKQLIYVINQKPKRFASIPLHAATTILARRIEERFFEALRTREEILNDFIEGRNPDWNFGSKSMSYEIPDRKALTTEIKEAISKCTAELLIMATENEVLRISYIYKPEIIDAIERGVDIFVIAPVNSEKLMPKIPNNTKIKIRTMKKIYGRMYIIDSREAIIMPSEGSIQERRKYDCGLHITNSDIAKILRDLYFTKFNSL